MQKPLGKDWDLERTKSVIWEIQRLREQKVKLPWLTAYEVVALAIRLGVRTQTRGFPHTTADRSVIEWRIRHLVRNRKWNRLAPWPEGLRDIPVSEGDLTKI